jgi:peptidoglycan-associated lipoprotein
MNPLPRLLSVATATALVSVLACHKKQAPAAEGPTPVPVSNENCNQACRDSIDRVRRMEDSIRLATEARNRAATERNNAIAAARASLVASIYFDFDMSDIRDDSRATLDRKVAVLSTNAGVRIRIEGNTDERGSDEYNIALGQRRAATAKRYLTDRGIDGARIEIVSYGEERPAQNGHDEAAWARNRRDDFVITAGGENIQPPPNSTR